jgi:hypothetical protein
MTTMISIDWDFFLWRGLEAKEPRVRVFPGTPNEEDIHAVHLFDWAHGEGHGPFMQSMMWQHRYGGFVRTGLDPNIVPGIREDKGCTPPRTFIEALEARFDFDDAFLFYADSHAMGFASVHEAFHHNNAQPVRVVHFDAHADMGYDTEQIEAQVKEGRTDCATWLYHAIQRGMVEHVDVIYPDWRNDEEREGLVGEAYIQEIADRVDFHRWSDWLRITNGAEPAPVILTNVARSSAWTPPWFDNAFEAFVELIPAYEMTCLDCTETFGSTPGGHDACTPRDWAPREDLLRAEEALAKLTEATPND